MAKLHWFLDINASSNDIGIDLNAPRVMSHLSTLISRVGSRTEMIVNDFVLGTFDQLRRYSTVQEAWECLDIEQQDIVIGFRNLLRKPVLGAVDDFPHLFYSECVWLRYMDITGDIEMLNEYASLTIEQSIEAAEQALRDIALNISTEKKATMWEIVRD